MPVTLRTQQIKHVSGAGKRGPRNLQFDHTEKQIVNLSCVCLVPNPITIDYTVAGSYTDILPLLPNRYVWQISGTIISGGAGGGGGGGGLFVPFSDPITGSGGKTNTTVFSIALSAIFPSGASVTSVVGAGGAGGIGGPFSYVGFSGGFGSSSSVTCNSIFIVSPPAVGGIGGVPGGGSPIGQAGGSGPGSSGSGGDGSTVNASSGLRGTDGRVVFTATPFYI